MAVRLPRETTRRLRVKAGTRVNIDTDRHRIVIKPAPKPRVTLKELVDSITTTNRHEKADWGRAVGKELW